MKLRRIVERMEALLNAEQRSRRRQIEELKELLKQLKKKERKLRREIEKADEPGTAETLQAKLKVVGAQRRKGVDALKTLRKS